MIKDFLCAYVFVNPSCHDSIKVQAFKSHCAFWMDGWVSGAGALILKWLSKEIWPEWRALFLCALHCFVDVFQSTAGWFSFRDFRHTWKISIPTQWYGIVCLSLLALQQRDSMSRQLMANRLIFIAALCVHNEFCCFQLPLIPVVHLLCD